MLPATKSFLSTGIHPATAQQKSATLDDLRGICLLMANREVARDAGVPIPSGPAALIPTTSRAEATLAKSRAASRPAPSAPAPKATPQAGNKLAQYEALPSGAAKRDFLAKHTVEIHTLAKAREAAKA